VRTAWGDIAVFRTGDDAVFAVDDRCPHQAGPLSQGLVHGHRVTCPLHDTEVCLRSGRALEAPGRVAVHAVKVVEGRVFLALPTGPALPMGASPPRA
jgi:nitrite reductase (NADH) small subunit